MTSAPPLAPPADAGPACPRCAAPLPAGVRFCTACGTASQLALIGAGEDEATPPQPAPAPTAVGDGREPALSVAQGEKAGPPRLVLSRASVDQVLAHSSLFGGLPAEVRRQLGALGFRRRYRAGAWVTHEGEHGDRAFVVLAGVAHATVLAGRGTRVLVRALAPGDLFGLAAATVGAPRAVSVQAVTALETLVLRQSDLADLMRAFPAFGDALLRQETVARTEAFLRRASPFAPLPPTVLAALAERMETKHFGAHDIVFREGDVGDAFYIVRHGRVAVIAGGSQIASLRAGDCFGEAALLTGAARGATIQAEEPTEVLRLDRAAFERVLAEYEEVRGFFVELLRRRDLLTPSVERAAGRIAAPQIPGTITDAVDYRPPRAAGILALGLAGLLAVLAATPRGGYLLYPAVIAALAIGPVAALFLARALDLWQELAVRRLAMVAVASAALAQVMVRALGSEVLADRPLERAAGGALGVVLSLCGLVVLAVARRGARLEIDSMVNGAVAGGSMGATLALAAATSVPGWGTLDRWPVAWTTLAALPPLLAVIGALAGSAVWAARTRRSPGALLRWLPFLVLLALPALAQPAPPPTAVGEGRGEGTLPAAVPVLAQVAALAIASAPARRRLGAAVTARAIALFTLGLAGGLRSAAGLPQVTCRGCGAPAQAGAVYCARCGLSLVEDEGPPQAQERDAAPEATPS